MALSIPLAETVRGKCCCEVVVREMLKVRDLKAALLAALPPSLLAAAAERGATPLEPSRLRLYIEDVLHERGRRLLGTRGRYRVQVHPQETQVQAGRLPLEQEEVEVPRQARQGLGPSASRAREVLTSDAAADVDAPFVDTEPPPPSPGSPNADRHEGDPPTASRRARPVVLDARRGSGRPI